MKGILFTPANIKATREKRKWMTRRLDHLKEINKAPDEWHFVGSPLSRNDLTRYFIFEHNSKEQISIKPRYQIGETIYIKEAHCIECFKKDGIKDACYKTDGDTYEPIEIDCDKVKWRSPMFMYEWAARGFIRVTGVLPQRLQDITEGDAIAEGIEVYPDQSWINPKGISPYQTQVPPIAYRDYCKEIKGRGFTFDPIHSFMGLWDSINPKYPWELNPWEWTYTYELIDGKVE